MKQSKKSKEEYLELVKKVSPNSHIAKDCAKAFFVGGSICALGEFISHILIFYGLPENDIGMYTSVVLIFIGVLMSGLGLYSKLGKFAGAGSSIPITGFANAVAAPAIEFKREGFIFGVASKMFIIAGPVIVYGIVSSMLVGFIYYFVR